VAAALAAGAVVEPGHVRQVVQAFGDEKLPLLCLLLAHAELYIADRLRQVRPAPPSDVGVLWGDPQAAGRKPHPRLSHHVHTSIPPSALCPPPCACVPGAARWTARAS